MSQLAFWWEAANNWSLYVGPFLLGLSTSKSSSKQTDQTPAELAGIRGPFADVIKNFLGAGSGPATLAGVPQGPDTTPAPITGNEQAVLDQLMQSQGPGNAASSLLQKTLAGNFLPGNPGGNPFLDAAIQSAQRSTFEGLASTLEKSLPGRFVQAGQFVNPQGSSAFDVAARGAASDAGKTAADIATQMSFAGYEQERGRQQDAIKLSQEEVDTSIKNLQAQALPRLIQELGIERGVEAFNTRLDAILKALQIATGAPLVNLGTESKSSSFGFQSPLTVGINR